MQDTSRKLFPVFSVDDGNITQCIQEALGVPRREREDDAIKVIDTRIGIPLYNVYLNEADQPGRAARQ
jgi:hypothetical protein